MRELEEMTIGQKIKELRTRKGYSQEVFANMLGMTPNGYAKIEQDKTPNLSLKRIKQIANGLDTDIHELLSIGDKTTHYIETQNNNDHATGFSYIVNQNMPQEYQRLQVENGFLKEKIELLEEKINHLEEIMRLKE